MLYFKNITVEKTFTLKRRKFMKIIFSLSLPRIHQIKLSTLSKKNMINVTMNEILLTVISDQNKLNY